MIPAIKANIKILNQKSIDLFLLLLLGLAASLPDSEILSLSKSFGNGDIPMGCKQARGQKA